MLRLEVLRRCLGTRVGKDLLRNIQQSNLQVSGHSKRSLHLTSRVFGSSDDPDLCSVGSNEVNSCPDTTQPHDTLTHKPAVSAVNQPRYKRKSGLHDRVLSEEELQRHNELLKASLSEDGEGDDGFGSYGEVQHEREHNDSGDSPKFGSLAQREIPGIIGETSFSHALSDPRHAELVDDEEPYIPRRYHNRKRQVYFTELIVRLANKGEVYEAIEVLEKRMLERERILPDRVCWSALIAALGRVGYTHKAFQLFNKMKKLGVHPSRHTYTSLFNACSNSPWKQDGLRRAQGLRELMAEKEMSPNRLTYTAMIKAFGMCGDILTAFSIVDEMSQTHALTGSVFNALLISCISDKEAGLKHAIEVWRRMRKRNIEISTRTYNLLLRAILECGVGDKNYANRLISSADSSQGEHITDDKKKKKEIDRDEKQDDLHIPWYKYKYDLPPPEVKGQTNTQPQNNQHILTLTAEEICDSEAMSSSMSEHLTSSDDSKFVKDQTVGMINSDQQANHQAASMTQFMEKIPNILNPRNKYDNVLALGDLSSPTNRLYLFGGIHGILSHMVKDSCKPNIKTFMMLLEIIASNTEAEEDLLAVMKHHRVSPDADFINMMINKRARRNDFKAAKALLTMMAENGLAPNVMTFACLAMGCNKKHQGLQLFEDLENSTILPNLVIYRTLLKRSYMDFTYKTQILRSMKKNGVKPDNKFLTILENQYEKANIITVKRERRQPVPEYFKSSEFVDGLRDFRTYYAGWLKTMELETSPHPWQRFREPAPVETNLTDTTQTV